MVFTTRADWPAAALIFELAACATCGESKPVVCLINECQRRQSRGLTPFHPFFCLRALFFFPLLSSLLVFYRLLRLACLESDLFMSTSTSTGSRKCNQFYTHAPLCCCYLLSGAPDLALWWYFNNYTESTTLIGAPQGDGHSQSQSTAGVLLRLQQAATTVQVQVHLQLLFVLLSIIGFRIE